MLGREMLALDDGVFYKAIYWRASKETSRWKISCIFVI